MRREVYDRSLESGVPLVSTDTSLAELGATPGGFAGDTHGRLAEIFHRSDKSSLGPELAFDEFLRSSAKTAQPDRRSGSLTRSAPTIAPMLKQQRTLRFLPSSDYVDCCELKLT